MTRFYLLLSTLLVLGPALAQLPDVRRPRPPFFRHEVSAQFGLMGEDFGGSYFYENRYTYFLGRRLGLSGSLGLLRSFEDETGFLPQAYTMWTAAAGVRLLPLASRRHRLSLTPAALYLHRSGIEPTGGSKTFDPSSPAPLGVLLTRPELVRVQALGWQVTAEYEFLPTPRLPLGLWFRIADNAAYDTYAAFGVQVGYRF